LLQPPLQAGAEASAVDRVDPSVHITKTVGRTDERVGPDLEDVTVADLDARTALERPPPRFYQCGVTIPQAHDELGDGGHPRRMNRRDDSRNCDVEIARAARPTRALSLGSSSLTDN
jgi:hypothetical protein